MRTAEPVGWVAKYVSLRDVTAELVGWIAECVSLNDARNSGTSGVGVYNHAPRETPATPEVMGGGGSSLLAFGPGTTPWFRPSRSTECPHADVDVAAVPRDGHASRGRRTAPGRAA